MYYDAIGQPRTSKTRRERAQRDINELLHDFSIEDIAYAAEWTARHKEDVRDFALVKHTIGEALTARDREEERNHQRGPQTQEEAIGSEEAQQMDEERLRRIKESPYHDVWQKTKEQLRSKMVPQSFSSWIAPLYISTVEDNRIVIDCPSTFVVDWLEDNYRGFLEDAVTEVHGREMQVGLVYVDETKAEGRRQVWSVRWKSPRIWGI